MSEIPLKILLVEDDEDDYILTKGLLDDANGLECTLDWISTYDTALETIEQNRHDIYLFDYHLGKHTGLELLNVAMSKGCKGPVIMLTGQSDHDIDVQAMNIGAADFLVKGQITVVQFERSIRYALDRKQSEEKVKSYSAHLENVVTKTTEDLKLSEEKYRAILENIEDGVYEADANGHWTFFNDSLCTVLGYPREELIGMVIQNLTVLDEKKERIQAFQIVLNTGVPIKGFDWEIVRKDGKKRQVETSVSPIKDASDQVIGIRGIIRDVTDRRQLEKELIEKRKLAEEANEAKSEFLANMSHEIRTPLNGVIGMSELAMDTDLDEGQKDLIHIINKEANSLLGIINSILDFSKIEAGKLELEHIAFDLRYVIENIAGSFAHRADQKGLTLISFLSPNVPCQLIGDPGRLRQILINLTENSVKFTDDGEIVIRAELEQDLDDKVKVRFWVRDTGIGIPKGKQETIFDGFTQADGSTTRKYGGTGLGTTISKQLVEKMGGEIGVESEEGQGSTFWFTALFVKQSQKQPISLTESIDLDVLKVLVVDENSISRYILKEYLRSWGCQPVEAFDGNEALSILKSSVANKDLFDLVILDCQNPGKDCFKLANEIKDMGNIKKIPMIVLISIGQIGDGKKCRDIGIEGYLTKPVKQADLRKAIVSVLGLSKTGIEPDQKLVTRHTIAEEQRNQIQILLVEDYPTNQQVAIRHLEKSGYNVDLAENGQEAVAAYKRKHYNLVLMDIQMPIMDGYEATKHIRAWEDAMQYEGMPDIHIPIIAITAHAVTGYREKCLEVGMDDYLSKPLKRKDLINLVDKWVKEISMKAREVGEEMMVF